MDIFLYKLISVELMLFAVLWAIYAIFVSWGTECFNMFHAYVTIIAFLIHLIWAYWVKPEMLRR